MGGCTNLDRGVAGWLAGVGLFASAGLAGCETMRQDFSAFGQGLMPVSPEQASSWMVDPTDPDNRRKGTVLISNSPFGGQDVYVSWYRDSVLQESDPLVKAMAISALGRHGGPDDALRIAVVLADDERFQVRWEAAKALQRLHNPAVVPALLATLRDDQEQSDIRVSAAIALGQYPQDRVFQALVAALDSPQLSINDVSRQALETLTGEQHGLEPEPWLRWYNGTKDPFAGQQEYLYPTYHRKDTFLEKLAFWSNRTYEQPAPPAGLESSTRRTYQDTDETAADEAGG